MHEYEFRLVVQNSVPFDTILQNIRKEWGHGILQQQHVWYAKPHFRFRDNLLEIKTIVSAEAVFHGTLWFKWIHSLETPYKQWSRSNHSKFLDSVGNFQCPLYKEIRSVLKLDNHAQVYTFKHLDGTYRLIFEWEYGIFPKPLEHFPTDKLLNVLNSYVKVLESFHPFSPPPYELNESMTRKPVTCVTNVQSPNEYLVAHKLDGTFGIVFSYANYIKEKWEGNLQKRHHNFTLGDGIVFAAEKLSDDTVVLLDVYQVRGIPTAKWCRHRILVNFLPRLQLPQGFQVQQYCQSLEELQPSPFQTDGYIYHNIHTDKIFKIKFDHSLDVVYMNGFFWLPSKEKPGLCKRFKCLENKNILLDGHVYEVSTRSGQMIRERKDRFMGNTWQQVENVLDKQEWQGPPIQEVIKLKSVKRRKIS